MTRFRLVLFSLALMIGVTNAHAAVILSKTLKAEIDLSQMQTSRGLAAFLDEVSRSQVLDGNQGACSMEAIIQSVGLEGKSSFSVCMFFQVTEDGRGLDCKTHGKNWLQQKLNYIAKTKGVETQENYCFP